MTKITWDDRGRRLVDGYLAPEEIEKIDGNNYMDWKHRAEVAEKENILLQEKIKEILYIIENDEDLTAIGACIKVASILRRIS